MDGCGIYFSFYWLHNHYETTRIGWVVAIVLKGTQNDSQFSSSGQISQHIFAPNEGYCLYIVGQSEHYAEILIYRSAIWYMHTVQNAEFLQLLNYSWSVNVNSWYNVIIKQGRVTRPAVCKFIDAGTDYRKLWLILLWYSLHSQMRNENLQKS